MVRGFLIYTFHQTSTADKMWQILWRREMHACFVRGEPKGKKPLARLGVRGGTIQ